MTSGLVNAGFGLPEWQAVKMIFFAPCSLHVFDTIQYLESDLESDARYVTDHAYFYYKTNHYIQCIAI